MISVISFSLTLRVDAKWSPESLQGLASTLDCTYLLIFAIKLKEQLLFGAYLVTVEDICRSGELVVLSIPFKSLDPEESEVLVPEQMDEKTKTPVSLL